MRVLPQHQPHPMQREVPTATAGGTREERPAPFAAGTRIGRYEIIELLGSGGLGNVYRAHDRALARDIALKILHRSFEPDARDAALHRRLLREGQALAKLSHPNVVTVYDVGTDGNVVFIAMELVHGQSLGSWLDAEASRDDVLRVLIAAGRGLAAAHAAGVTHGDFKPANVMLSGQGHVRIVDFGLARSIVDDGSGDGVRAGSSAGAGGASAPEAGPWPVTSRHGTPGYIAPELLRGAASAATLADQFSFAVTAFVALSGKRPFVGQTLPSDHGFAASNARKAWPFGVPDRIRRVIERGMALAPADRHTSVEAMVDALERAARPRRRGVWMALSLSALLLAGGAALARGRVDSARCQLDSSAFTGVWDAERRAAVETALQSTGRPNAGEAFSLLSARLDAYRAEWQQMQREACQSSLVSGAQSERVFALRSKCLRHKLAGVAALVDAFAHANASSVDRAAAAMPDPIQECANVAALTGVADTLPEDPAQRAAIDEISSGMAVLSAELAIGGASTGRARELHQAALAIGHAPTIALTLSGVGRTLIADRRGGSAMLEGKKTLNDAIRLAAAVGDRRLLAKTASHLLVVVSFQEEHTDEADAMLPMVDAAVTRAGNDPEDRLGVLISQGSILSQRGRYRESNAVFERAVTLSREVQSHRRAYGAHALGQIGDNYIELRQYDEAVRRRQAELDGARSIYGSRHPRIILILCNLGIAQVRAGRLDDARATAENLREMLASIASDDWRQATLPFLEGNIVEGGGDCVGAIPLYRVTIEKLTAFFGPDHTHAADMYERLGACLHATDRGSEAIANIEHSLAIRRSLGTTSKIAEVAFQLADVLWARDERARGRAITLAEEAASLWSGEDVSELRINVERWLAARTGNGPSGEPAGSTARFVR
jgi:tetratricopeptide (TPR) repeat protein/predicted Ser/Thr protein kinase